MFTVNGHSTRACLSSCHEELSHEHVRLSRGVLIHRPVTTFSLCAESLKRENSTVFHLVLYAVDNKSDAPLRLGALLSMLPP